MDKKPSRYIKTVNEKVEPITLYLKPPDYEISRLCDIEFTKAWTFCFSEGVKTHATLLNMFKENGEWTDEHERELNELNVQIAVKAVLLEKHKKDNKIDKAKELALEIMKLRNQAMQLSELKQQPYLYSCEHAAQEIRMEAYIAYATVYADDHNKRYFKDYKDFTERREERAALDVYNAYLQLVLQENTDYIRGLPENKFLIEIGALNDQLRPVRKKTISTDRVKKKKKRPTKKKKSVKAKRVISAKKRDK